MSENLKVEPRTPCTLCALGFDLSEHHVLSIARYFFETYAKPHSQSWNSAFTFGRSAFGHRKADGIVLQTHVVVDTLRRSRASGFSYLHPECTCCLGKTTAEERYLLSALHNERRGARSAVSTALMMLCEGQPPIPMKGAISALSGMLEPPQGGLPDDFAFCALSSPDVIRRR